MFDKFEQELKDLGLTPAEIKQAIKDKKASDERVTALEAEATTLKKELETTKGSFTEVQTRLQALEVNPQRREEKKTEPVTKTDFLDDGDKAFSERFSEGIAPVLSMAFQAASNTARMSAKNSLFGKRIKTPSGDISMTNLWDRWSSDIDSAAGEMMKTNAAALQYERTWLNLFNYIKGNKMEELMSKPETFVESVSSGVDRTVIDNTKPDKLNDEETSIANKMARYGKGVTPEKILETRKKLKFGGVIA